MRDGHGVGMSTCGVTIWASSTGGRRVLRRNQCSRSNGTRRVVWNCGRRRIVKLLQFELCETISEVCGGADARRVMAESRVVQLELGRDGSDPHADLWTLELPQASRDGG